MNRAKITSLSMLLFLLLLVATVVYTNYLRPRILVLHSYSPDYVWTDHVNQGLQRILSKQNRADVRYYYMKTKKFRHQSDLRRTEIAALRTVKDLQPDVIIAVDDNAQKMVAKKFVDNPHIKIVFAGINGNIDIYGYHQARNVTGILERKPAAAIREMLLFLANMNAANGDGDIASGINMIASLAAPAVTAAADRATAVDGKPANLSVRALFLGDSSHSVTIDAEYLASFDWSPVDYRGAEFVDTYADWQQQVLSIDSKTDFLLVSGYRRLKLAASDDYAAPEDVMAWTEAHSPVPVIGMNVFNAAEGAGMSVGVSGYEQGEVAAGMALDILNKGTPIDTIPVQTSQQYILALRQPALDRRGIRLPKIFEAFSRVTNNYFE